MDEMTSDIQHPPLQHSHTQSSEISYSSSFGANPDPFSASPSRPVQSTVGGGPDSGYPSPKSMGPPLPDKRLTPARSDSFGHIPQVRPPPLRKLLSTGPSSGYLNGLMPQTEYEEVEDSQELTTKGRKRKRLAKACSACHKNKRRCDGFAPCSNCEFSSRPCLYVNANGEPIPPPRTRNSSLAAGMTGRDESIVSLDSGWDRRDSRFSRRSSVEAINAISHSRPEVLEAVDKDLMLSSELLNIFFRRVPPFSAMFHPPTFSHRQYLNQTSPILLDVMFAFAARLCDSPSFIRLYPPGTPSYQRGEPFADRAHTAAEKLLKKRRSWSDEEARKDSGTWEETELAQSTCLLSIYFAMLRQPSLALFYLDVSISLLRPRPDGNISPPASHLGLSSPEYLTLLECRHRTFWMIVLHDLCAAANGRPRRLLHGEMRNVPLPGGEHHWVRYGGAAAPGREIGRRDGLAYGSGHWNAEEGSIGELGHVLRILSVFSDIMAVANNGGAGSSDIRQAPPHQHEHALKAWANSLPRHLRFDETNLHIAITKLQSPVAETSLSGWLYAYMHSVAECGMFYLQAAIAQQPGAVLTAQRQSQAVDNIGVILDALGERGREGPLLIFPIAVVSNWQDHLRSSTSTSTLHQNMLDERLAVWWSEVYREWGQERGQVSAQAQHPAFSSHSSSSASQGGPFHPPPQPLPSPYQSGHRHTLATISPTQPSASSRRFEPSLPSSSNRTGSSTTGLGLYQTSPPYFPDSAKSTNSTMSLVTPGTSRTSLLPPLRPRAASLATTAIHTTQTRSPSPPPVRIVSASGSISGITISGNSSRSNPPGFSGEKSSISNFERDGAISLPPLAFRSDRKQHPFVIRTSDSPNGINGNNSPRFQPYFSSSNNTSSPKERSPLKSTFTAGEYPDAADDTRRHPLERFKEPSSKSLGSGMFRSRTLGAVDKFENHSNGGGSNRDRGDNDRGGDLRSSEPIGIAALVSAAETHRENSRGLEKDAENAGERVTA